MKRYEICFHRDVVEVQRIMAEGDDEHEAAKRARLLITESNWQRSETGCPEYHCAEVLESRKTKEGE